VQDLLNKEIVVSTVLFFDLDGTIIVNPFGSVVFPRVSALLAAHSGVSAERMMQAILLENRRRQETPLPSDSGYASIWDWDDIVQAVAAQYGLPAGSIPPRICEELAIEHAAPPHTGWLDQSLEVIAALRAPNRRLVVATMGLAKYQLPVLRGLRLAEHFDDFLTPDLTGYLKTDQRYYGRYLDGFAEARRISIGDNYSHDVEIPKSMGFRAVLRFPMPALNALSPYARADVLDPYGGHISAYPVHVQAKPDAVITHLRELLEVIPALEA